MGNSGCWLDFGGKSPWSRLLWRKKTRKKTERRTTPTEEEFRLNDAWRFQIWNYVPRCAQFLLPRFKLYSATNGESIEWVRCRIIYPRLWSFVHFQRPTITIVIKFKALTLYTLVNKTDSYLSRYCIFLLSMVQGYKECKALCHEQGSSNLPNVLKAAWHIYRRSKW